MEVGYLVLFILAVIFAIGLLATLITLCALPPKTNTIGPQMAIQTGDPTVPNGMNQAYANSSTGGFQLDNNAKPFIVRMPKDQTTQNAFLFSDIAMFFQNHVYRSMGFTFAVNNPTTVVAFQVIDQCFLDGTRQVGIFNVQTRAILASASVSKATDPLVSGFRTHVLAFQDQILLTPLTLYACIAVVQPNDFNVFQEGFALPINNILMDNRNDESKLGVGRVGFIEGDNLTLPSTFAPFNLSSPFPSFQVQQQKSISSPVFQIDSQFATLPLSYIRNLTFEVLNSRLIRVQAGECSSVYGDTNLFAYNVQDLAINSLMLAQNTWYGVFLVAEQTIPPNPNNAVVMLSKTYPEVTGITNNFVRRIGFVKTRANDASQLYLVKQTGNATTRTYAFLNPSETIQTVDLGDGNSATLDLNFVSPTASSCVMQIDMKTPDNTSVPVVTLDIGPAVSLVFRQGQSYQVLTTTVPLSSSLIPQAIEVTAHIAAPFVENPVFIFTVLYFTEDL